MRLILLILMATSLEVRAQINLKIENSIGRATNSRGELVYIEKHASQFSQGQLQRLKTEYFTEDSVKFGSIQSDFTLNEYVPNYSFEDSRHGRQAGVTWHNSHVIAYAKKEKDTPKQQKRFAVTKETVAGQGLHNFLRKNIDEFVKKPKLKQKVNFLIPMNQDVYSFRVRVKELKKQNQQIVLRIEAESWLFRLISPYIDVTYDIQTNQLIKYQGPSNLLSQKGQTMNVTIDYTYLEYSYAQAERP